jgi:regulator of sigma E protease
MPHILSLLHTYAIPFIIVISVVVFIHEFGHYWVARRCGVRVLTFSIGFGKEIIGWNDKHGTRWKISWLPLGGYVKMFGDADPASTPDAAVHTMTEEEKKVAFYHQSVGKRMAIVVAGPAVNYIFAILVLSFMFIFEGQPYSPPDISTIIENSAAAKAGLQVGDHITSIDDHAIDRFEDLKRIVMLNEGSPIPLDITRQGQAIHFTLTPEVITMTDRFGGTHKGGRIGIGTDKINYKKWPPVQAVQHALIETWNISASTLRAIGQMIMGTRGSEELGGVLRIAEMSGKVAKDGVVSLIWFMGMISINLGLINLFPVPMLDGGHLAMYAFERMKGKPLPEKIQEISARVGLILVMTLMLFATWNDLNYFKVFSTIKGWFS